MPFLAIPKAKSCYNVKDLQTYFSVPSNKIINNKKECAKFRGSCGSCATVPACLRGSEHFSREYFVGLKFFLVGISWVSNFFSWVFRGSKIL